MWHDDKGLSDGDFAIAELRYYQDQRRKQEMYEVSLFSSTEHIKEMLTDDQIKSWKIVEALISKEVAENKLIDEHVRRILSGEQP